ncbi:MAG: nucleotidyltransferase family protein, partial [Thermodesulfobacteriota bacterium]|nr:nucleotidyltransferase family protein [Thermodesulfobacteriota bacterium]
IELHYRCFNDPRLFPLNIDQVLKEQRFLTIAGRQVQTLTIEDTILYLCVHGSLHAWFRLFWLCDIAEILEKSDTIDWVWLMTRAAEMRVKRFLVYGLVISNLLLSSPLPASMVAYVDQDKGVFTLIQMALRIMNGPEDLPYRPFSYPYILEKLYELKLCSNLRYKFFVCLRYLNTIPYDWQAVPLPDSLFPLYYILRPFLWFWRWCAK